ncbi:MAG: hypothetical protein RLP44_02205 [Aggregatilineales bacterium]
MTLPTQQQLFDGSNVPPAEMVTLRAGALTLLYDNGTIRHIKLGEVAVLHQIYATVRNQNWGTVSSEIHDLTMDIQPDHFDIQFTMHHQEDDIDFAWQGHISGDAQGTVTFSFEGIANSTFKRNRIGFCVLHPMQLAGKTCLVEHVDGAEVDGAFPALIAPHQPYFDMRALTHEVVPGLQARVLMEGDTFEMEDQRNWIDASYKTYCTPLSLPFPVSVEKGERVSQKITLSLMGELPQIDAEARKLHFIIGDEAMPLPSPGLGLPENRALPTERQIEHLRALNLAHLRADVRFDAENPQGDFDHAVSYAKLLNTQLELALFLTDNAENELNRVKSWLNDASLLARLLIFHVNEKSTQRDTVTLARQVLGALDVPIGAGTDAFFAELNRARPPADVLDFVTYSINPQVHAFDNLSLAETLAAHVPTVQTARDFSGADTPIIVSPVTFKMRWNPNATGEPPPIPAGELPPQVDPRQMSLFGAGWTLGSIKYLAESGVHSATYYETIGWRGVMNTLNDSPVPQKFASVGGTIFPMFHVFRALGEFVGGEVIISHSTHPRNVEGLTLFNGQNFRVILANLTAKSQSVTLENLVGDCTVRVLDEAMARACMTDPDTFWAQSTAFNGKTLELPPYALAIVDQEVR